MLTEGSRSRRWPSFLLWDPNTSWSNYKTQPLDSLPVSSQTSHQHRQPLRWRYSWWPPISQWFCLQFWWHHHRVNYLQEVRSSSSRKVLWDRAISKETIWPSNGSKMKEWSYRSFDCRIDRWRYRIKDRRDDRELPRWEFPGGCKPCCWVFFNFSIGIARQEISRIARNEVRFWGWRVVAFGRPNPWEK